MMAPCTKDALFFFSTRGFNFATRKTNLDTPVLHQLIKTSERVLNILDVALKKGLPRN